MRDGTRAGTRERALCHISIHPPLAGRDVARYTKDAGTGVISIHPPLAGRDAVAGESYRPCVISIHPPLAGRDYYAQRKSVNNGISIHPPLAGRDFDDMCYAKEVSDFNPPAPCGTGPNMIGTSNSVLRFQSTRPLRDGTWAVEAAGCDSDISIHPPLAGRDDATFGVNLTIYRISIHPPLAGRDKDRFRHPHRQQHFNPPAPCGTGRFGRRRKRDYSDFNPPAPCGTGRSFFVASLVTSYFNPPAPCGTGRHRTLHAQAERNFNPPAPCGTGLGTTGGTSASIEFQSTRPLRDGTRDGR